MSTSQARAACPTLPAGAPSFYSACRSYTSLHHLHEQHGSILRLQELHTSILRLQELHAYTATAGALCFYSTCRIYKPLIRLQEPHASTPARYSAHVLCWPVCLWSCRPSLHFHRVAIKEAHSPGRSLAGRVFMAGHCEL